MAKVTRLKPRNEAEKSKFVKPPIDAPFKIRIGVGEEEGFLKFGPAHDSPYLELDTKKFPWPVEDGVVDMLYVYFYLHRLTRPERREFMNEAGRILKVGAQAMFVVPYWSSRAAVVDPFAEWPPIAEESFLEYSKMFRERTGLEGKIPLTCDFTTLTPQGDIVVMSGHIAAPHIAPRNEEYRAAASRDFVNSVQELHVTLTKSS
jgi:predicted SAM-dependent methyltransferase